MSDMIDLAMSHATRLGAEAGRAAAGWWQQDAVGGRTSGDVTPVARKVLAGIEDGDPMVLDALPGLDLSDPRDEADIARGVLAGVGLSLDDVALGVVTDLGDAYSLAFSAAVQDAVTEACQAVLV